MKDLNEPVLAKCIFYNKKTKLCIFEINQGKLKWINIHLDNIEGKFYNGCSAKLYQQNEILKALISEPNDKKGRRNNH